jgi:hypothetical protein
LKICQPGGCSNITGCPAILDQIISEPAIFGQIIFGETPHQLILSKIVKKLDLHFYICKYLRMARRNRLFSQIQTKGHRMRFNQEVKKWATDLHIFLHKAEVLLPQCQSPEEFITHVFDSFEEKPQFLSNDEVEEMLLELWSAYKDGRLNHID